MTDFADESSVGSLLDGNSLRSVEFPTVRKGGLDADAVLRTIYDAANQLDSLHQLLDERDAELRGLAEERDAAVAEAARADELLATPSHEADVAGATTILTSAQRVADETRAEAEAEAARVLESVETTRAEAAEVRASAALEAEATRERAAVDAGDIIANARERAEAEVDDLTGQIAGLRAQRDVERGDLAAQFEEYRNLAVAAHERAVGSLAAALASLEGYVSSVAEDDEMVDTVIDTFSTERVADDAPAETGTQVNEEVLVSEIVVEGAELLAQDNPGDDLFSGDYLTDTVGTASVDVGATDDDLIVTAAAVETETDDAGGPSPWGFNS